MPILNNIFPGDQDWQNKISWGGIFGPMQQVQPPVIPTATPPTGSFADKLVGKLNSPAAQLGLRILANNRGGQSVGNVLGQSVLGYQQDQQSQQQSELQRQLLQAQIQRMQQPEEDRGAPVVIMGADGKPRYASRQEAIGQQPFQQPLGESSLAGSIQEYNQAKSTGFNGSYLEFLKERAKATQQVPQEPLVTIQTPDGRSIYVPRNQAIGAQPAAPKENFTPQEGERTSANYFGRMQAAEGLLGDYQPSLMDYIAAGRVMNGGAVTGTIANNMLSPQGQKYYQAAADWVRAKLRKESGAVISPEEMAQEIKTYFPMPGDNKETIEQKKVSRQQAMSGMKEMGGRAVRDSAPATKQNDPLGIR
jgi:hypothetical protein